jgi:hypothetical protein
MSLTVAAPLGSRRRLNGNPVVVSYVYLGRRGHRDPLPQLRYEFPA